MNKHTEPSDALRALRFRIDELVRVRHFGSAYRLAWALPDSAQVPAITELHFLRALTANLTNHHDQAEAAHVHALNHCPDFTPLLDGDFERDHLLWAIRARKFEVARWHLRQARRRHEDDDNRMAGLLMGEARLFYGEGDYFEAIDLHRQAEAEWNKLGVRADPQWQFNNRVHLLKAMLAHNYHPQHTEVQEVTQQLIDTMHLYGSRSIRLALWADQRYGRPANRADDLLQRTRHVLSGLR